MKQPVTLGVEDDLRMAPAMDGFIPIDFSQSELKVIHKLDDKQVLSTWKDLRSHVKTTLDKKYRSTGEIESVMQPPHPKAGAPVDKISNPHLIQYNAGHGRTKNFVCRWDVRDEGSNANHKELLLGMKNFKIYENEEEEEYEGSTVFVEEPPKPDKPLVSQNDRKAKVGLLVLSHFKSWPPVEYIQGEKVPRSMARNPIAKLVQRMKYLYRLFEGCNVELMLYGMAMTLGAEKMVHENLQEIGGAIIFDRTTQTELYGRLLRSKYDFGLMINVRRDSVECGMGYGLEESHERLLLRGFGLACRGNYLFGDWGRPSDYGTDDSTNWDDIEIAGAYDSSAYMDQQLKGKVYKFAYNQTPIHARPFARLVRLGRFIRPISSDEMKLRDVDIERIWSATRGEEFSAANLWATWWSTYNALFFARDLIETPYYVWKWRCIQSVQAWFAAKYVGFQYFYWNSYELEWAELLLGIAEKVFKCLRKTLLLACFIAVVLIVAYVAYDCYPPFYSWKSLQ